MFTAIKENKIIAYNSTGYFPCLIYDRVEEMANEELVEVGGEYVVKTDKKAIEKLQKEVRSVRNSYLEEYVDPYQLVLRWETLSDEDKEQVEAYRQYLLDYTLQDSWWESDPKTFDEWKENK